MQFFKNLVVFAAAMASVVRAAPIPAPEAVSVEAPALESRAGVGSLTIVNKCQIPIFVMNGNDEDSTRTVNPGQSSPGFTMTGSAQTYKMAYSKTDFWTSKLSQVEFTNMNNGYYNYDFSLQKGNPFEALGQALTPSTNQCTPITCAPNQFPCGKAYNTEADNHVSIQPNYNCPSSTSMVFTACGES